MISSAFTYFIIVMSAAMPMGSTGTMKPKSIERNRLPFIDADCKKIMNIMQDYSDREASFLISHLKLWYRMRKVGLEVPMIMDSLRIKK